MPGVGFEPTRDTRSQISGKHPDHYTKSQDSNRESKRVKTKSVGRRPTGNQVTVAELPYMPPPEVDAHVFDAKMLYLPPVQ